MFENTKKAVELSNEIDTLVGQNIRKRREKLNLKKVELGDAVGVSYQQIQKYERGENKVPAGRLFQLAQVLGVSPDYFYHGVRSKNNEDQRTTFLCTKRTKPINILLVEDDPTDQMLTRNALDECSIPSNLYVIQDGEKALEFLRHHIDDDFPRPDIILLDLNIPKRDGFHVLREINRDATLSDIPVIIMTNSNDPNHMINGYRNNICGYISKSFDVNTFNRNIFVTLDYWSTVTILPSMQK